MVELETRKNGDIILQNKKIDLLENKTDNLQNEIKELSNEVKNLKISKDEKLKYIYDYTLNIVDKQYRSYVWNDTKVQSLITINAALFAGLLVIRQLFGNMDIFPAILLIVSLVLQIMSLIILLIHIVPRINSKIGNELNLRTMVGITPYTKTQTKDDYLNKMLELDIEQMIKQNCYQIVGMCKNNLRSEAFIRKAVVLTIVSVAMMVIMVACVFVKIQITV